MKCFCVAVTETSVPITSGGTTTSKYITIQVVFLIIFFVCLFVMGQYEIAFYIPGVTAATTATTAEGGSSTICKH